MAFEYAVHRMENNFYLNISFYATDEWNVIEVNKILYYVSLKY